MRSYLWRRDGIRQGCGYDQVPLCPVCHRGRLRRVMLAAVIPFTAVAPDFVFGSDETLTFA